MSGQYPHSSTPSSQQHQFIRQHGPPHHLPPAPPTPLGQYRPPQTTTQRPLWGHPTGGAGVVYGSPHLSSYNIPGRSQPWPKPNESRYTLPASSANPLYNLPMQLTQNVIPSVLSESRLPGNYNQEETIDLSSHSLSVERREKDVLRNGATLETAVRVDENFGKTDSAVNGDFAESYKPAINTENKDAVSVIAQNPLNDVLNCSKSDKDCGIKLGESALTKSIEALVRNASLSNKNLEQDSGNTAEYLGIRSPELNKNASPEISKSLAYSENTSFKNFEPANKFEYLDTKDVETGNTTEVKVHNLETSAFKISENVDKSETLIQNQEITNVERNISTLENVQHLVGSNEKIPENVSLENENIEEKNKILQDNLTNSFVNSNNIIPNKPTCSAEVTSEDTPSIKEETINLENELLHVMGCSQESTSEDQRTNDALIETKSTDLPKPDDKVKNMSGDWESPNHTAENVESILENMFNAQDDKTSQIASQSVIVSNETKTSLLDELRTDKSTIIVPMKEEELAQTLLEEPKEIKHEVNDKSLEKIMDELHSGSEKDEVKKEDTVQQFEEPMEVEEMKENIPEVAVNQVNAIKLVSKDSVAVPVESNVSSETEKNPFIEVESELEKMFAGIVEPASETNENQASTEIKPSLETKKPLTAKRPVVRRKPPNRRFSDNSVFGTESKKKSAKRLSDVDGKKSKKTKLESGWDSPSGKKVKGFHKDISNDMGVNKKGPFIHVEGSKETPTSVVVVNSGVRPEDEEGTEKAISRRKHSSYQRPEGKAARQRGTGLYSSTLSSRYDAQTADTTWICIFCKRGPHCEGGLGGQPAGDLFGPYRISSSPPEDMTVSPSDRDVAEEQKRRGGGKQQSLRASGGVEHFVQKMARKNKRMSLDEHESFVGMTLIPGEAKEVGYEVWTHEQCATWAPGVYIVGSKLVGIEEAVWAAVKTKCNQCGDTGAGLGCVVRNCVPRVHYGCALLCSWHLEQDTFIAKCNHHRKSYYASGMLRPS